MSQNNSRLIEKDIFAAQSLQNAQGGSSEIIDLFGSSGGASKYSLQAVYDVQSFSAAVIASSTDIFTSSDPDHPSQFRKTSHGFTTGLKVQIATSNTLPAPFQAVTDYFVIRVDANYFKLATTLNNALAGTAVAITNVGVGNQTVTAVALAGATVTFQKSNDRTNWIDIQSATSISSDGSVMIEQANVSYRYVKAVKAITAGAVILNAYICVLGDAS